MRYHVPFAHRKRTAGPVYIGFDEPVSIQKRKRRFNWSGFIGLLLALISPFTLFVIAPLALLFSLVGMRRAPRGLAFVGLIFSLLATIVLSLGVYGIARQHTVRKQRFQARQVRVRQARQIALTTETLEGARDELLDYRQANNRRLPDLEQGMFMVVHYKDAWKEPLSYQIVSDGCLIRSKGPDREFDTPDDLTLKLTGQAESWSPGQDVAIE